MQKLLRASFRSSPPPKISTSNPVLKGFDFRTPRLFGQSLELLIGARHVSNEQCSDRGILRWRALSLLSLRASAVKRTPKAGTYGVFSGQRGAQLSVG